MKIDEPPDNVGISPSISAHQILSLLAQTGGAHIGQIWKFMEETNAYRVEKDDLKNILRRLKERSINAALKWGNFATEKGENLPTIRIFIQFKPLRSGVSTPMEESLRVCPYPLKA